MATLSRNPDLSVVVCHHVGDLIYGFLDSIYKSDGDFTYEVIVMTSQDDLSMKRYAVPPIVISYPGLPAEKRNAGARVSRGKLVAFFDDDVEVDPLCLYHLKEGIVGEIAMTYGKLWNMEYRNRLDESGSFLTWTGFLYSRAAQHIEDKGQFNDDEYVLSGKSASCMIRKQVFNRVGCFDEDFGILGEETDLAWRVWLRGYKVLYTPNATGFHAFNTRFKPKEKYYTSERVQFNGCRNYITMLLKNLGKEHLWIVPIHMMIWFTAGLVMLITGKIRQGANILKGLWYVISHLKGILDKRLRIQGFRVTDESVIWPVITRTPPRGYYTQRFTRYLRSTLHG